MPRREDFILKDSSPEIIKAADVEPKGRTYNVKYENKTGAVHIDDILLGTKLACIAITDDDEDTLANVGKLNPWHIEALTMITGSKEEAHKPLTNILDKHFNLKIDKNINLSGWHGGHAIDTQGYIAHNDEIIVVAFRCTTSAQDWITNFTASSTPWELDIDLDQGHSGWCSCLEGRFFSNTDKPRVHTGFYNNLLQTIPILDEYVKPLLDPSQPPRKLYVVGHSLGAGMSTLATCYFLENYQWKNLPHKLINISIGTPKSMKKDMAEKIEGELKELVPLGKVSMIRVVMNEDIVARVPPNYYHVGRLVFLTEDGHVLVNPKDPTVIEVKDMKELIMNRSTGSKVSSGTTTGNDDEKNEPDGDKSLAKSEYDKKMEKIPQCIREHCPDCYLKPLIRLYQER